MAAEGAAIGEEALSYGVDVVQLYIAPPKSGLHRPEQELKGFARVELAPSKSKRATFPLDGCSFAV